jgi:CPA1 family monovalent cation:H+ antiporter
MLDREISRRISVTNRQFTDLYRRYPGLLQKQEFTARKKLLYAEHQAIEKLLGEGFLSEELGSERKRTVQQGLEAVREKGIKKPDPT